MPPERVIPLQISGYYILPLALPTLPSFPFPATHYLYLRPHEPKIPDAKSERSIFLVGVPFDASELHMKHLFSTQLGLPSGRIEKVKFAGTEDLTQSPTTENNRKGKDGVDVMEELESEKLPSTWDRVLHQPGSTAIVVFVDRASLEAVIKAVKRVRKKEDEIVWGEGVEEKLPALGEERYLNHLILQYPDKDSLLESVNGYMTRYDAREAARARASALERQEPDEDGFVKVTRGGRIEPARQEEANKKLEKQKEKQKGLEDFYRFQSREKRKERAAELVRKFELDKEKVRELKEKRGGFKPS